jgi:aspartyl-tRNA(Asn)/glutamyl-tRNA(Gln) amidotransferase subunit C
MTVSAKELKKSAHLSYLDIDTEASSHLLEEIGSIMDFADTLRTIDTSHVAPLFHPLALHQRVREDLVTEESCLAELEAIAPLFEDNVYLVPKVIDSGKSK